jgi:5,10-methylenetetrahydromethanopterin reductase
MERNVADSRPEVIPASVNLMPEGPVGRIVELATEAERLGFRRCWVYDEGLAARDVHVTLAAIATATEQILLGPGITNPHTRHPGVTAAAVASLDELSGGRAFLGLGAGGALTLDPMGIDRGKPLTAVREMVHACRALFSGESLDLDGETVQFVSARLDYARPDIEIWLAGRGPKMMRTAGELADGVNLSYVHKATLGALLASIRSAASGGPEPKISYTTKIVSSDSDFEAARRNLSFRLLDQPGEVQDLIGFGPDDAVALRAALGEGGPSAAARLVEDDWVLPFVIAGTPAECAAELRSLLAEHAFDEFQLPVQELDEAEATMADVAGLFRGD